MVDGEPPVWVLCQILERDVGLPLADHQMDNDERLVDDGPGRVAEPVLQGAEDLGDAGLAGVRGDEDVLDILGLGGRELAAAGQSVARTHAALLRRRTLILVPPLTDFSNELAMGSSSQQGRGRRAQRPNASN